MAFEAAAQHRILETFREWDADGSGKIEYMELKNVILHLGVPEEKIPNLFKVIDVNHDDLVDYVEFIRWLFGSAAADLPTGAEKKLWGQKALKDILRAASIGDADKAVQLLSRDKLVGPDDTDDEGTTVLMAAAKGGQLSLVRSLLDMNCCGLNAVDHEGHSALDYAIASSRTRVVEYMTETHTANDNTKVPFLRALLPAIQRKDAESIRRSVHPSVAFTIYIDRHMETFHGLTTIPLSKPGQLLIKQVDAGLVEDWNNKRPELQVKPGDRIVKINEVSGDYHALQVELGKYQESTIYLERDLPKQRCNPNALDERGTPYLHHAVKGGDPEVVTALLSADGISINAQDHFGRSPLDVAMDLQNEAIMQLLKSQGAKLSKEMKSLSGKLGA